MTTSNKLDGAMTMLTDEVMAREWLEKMGVDLAPLTTLTAFCGFVRETDRNRALLSASKPAVAMGWKLVPVEPTEEMILAGLQGDVPKDAYARDIYEAMLAAAPAAPAQSGEPVGYDGIVSICDAHGIGLPVDCIEMVVEIIRLASYRGDDTLRYPAEFTDDLQWILGLFCFQCITYAQVLRKAGRDIPNNAEAEQAATLDWMLRHYLRDPVNWRDTAADEMRAWNVPASSTGDQSK